MPCATVYPWQRFRFQPVLRVCGRHKRRPISSASPSPRCTNGRTRAAAHAGTRWAASPIQRQRPRVARGAGARPPEGVMTHDRARPDRGGPVRRPRPNGIGSHDTSEVARPERFGEELYVAADLALDAGRRRASPSRA